jgi:4-hydroxybenzoyl-CoA thioesterase
MQPTFQKIHKIKFSECDPAGIVFYPQYFVLFNDLIEEWVNSILPSGYEGIIVGRRIGMPTVHLEVDFKAIARMGEEILLSLKVLHLGNSSIKLAWAASGKDGVIRLNVNQTIVMTSLETHRPIPLPDDIRAAMSAT